MAILCWLLWHEPNEWKFHQGYCGDESYETSTCKRCGKKLERDA